MISTLAALAAMTQVGPAELLTFEGKSGPGKGKQVVLLAGDEEYRSEEGLPQLAKILAEHHGFRCTVLFSLDDKGFIDPNRHDNQPGLEALDKADLCIMLLRFRAWPDSQMKHFADYLERGKPIIGLRTSTHAFDYPADSKSAYRQFGWKSEEWPGGFGKQVLGENWISHWGQHKEQATMGLPAPGASAMMVMKGVGPIFANSDVYEAKPPSDASILVLGQVLSGMSSANGPAFGAKKRADGVEQELNKPMMPVAWTRFYKGRNRVFTTTMGAATDLLSEDLRRMLVNASYWCTGMELKIPKKANVSLVGEYTPTMYGFDGFKRGVKPLDLKR